MSLSEIKARADQSITEIVDNPREYYRVQQILRDRAFLLAEVERMRTELANVVLRGTEISDDAIRLGFMDGAGWTKFDAMITSVRSALAQESGR